MRKMLADQRGTIAIMAAILLPVLLGFAGLAVDAGFDLSSQVALTSQATAAAMSSARAQMEFGDAITAGDLERVAQRAAVGADSEVGAPAVEGITSVGGVIGVRVDARMPAFLVSVGQRVISAAAGARWYPGSGAGTSGVVVLVR